MLELKINDIIKIEYVNSYILMSDLKAKIVRGNPRDVWAWVFEWLDDPTNPMYKNTDYLGLMNTLGYDTQDTWLWSSFCGEIAETIIELWESGINNWRIFENLESIDVIE